MWDLRNTTQCVSQFRVENAVEDFCCFDGKIVIAHGNTLTLGLYDGVQIRRLNDFYPFQKPCLKVKYDRARERVIAGGMDSQLKFFHLDGADKDQLSVDYKIKLPSEIFAFDISTDGNHFALGLNDSSLIIRSKLKDVPEDAGIDEEQKMYAQFAPAMKKTSKDYKYFNRGQYVVKADPSDL